ncbi:MAG: hypothetical protein B7Z55_13680 [Planctomycetales bacterium 12-60-4]|nr:MAG: hypothetical protein B7Z55_13680 [Planctomycetales bacterium 12-60-4]
MLTKKPQAIAGVSSNYENVVEELYPSITSTWLGQFLNSLYESIPLGGPFKLSYLFVAVTWPLALLGYLALKVAGSKYVLTNRAVKRLPVLGIKLLEEVPLSQLDRVTVDPDSRLGFFKTGDVRLSSADGGTLMLIRGVPYPDRFCQVIDEMRDARRFTEDSLNVIRGRKA